ncbi:bifunctional pantoate--beta-alanine ligase/(d)CMP kinase [Trichothermofontia sp.]
MRLFTTIAALRCYLDQYRAGKLFSLVAPGPDAPEASHPDAPQIGLVPTMGALHAGHQSLIAQARRENGLVVVSIFVNPLQFGPQEDLDRYPQTLEADRQLCETLGVDVIFAPSPAELIGAAARDRRAYTQVVPPPAMLAVMCGPHRPGHFEGVATIVTKLLQLVQPDRAYFGEKDAQQLAIIRRIVADLNLSVDIMGCPIVREASGLAYSSRNQYLTPAEREHAAGLYRSLQAAVAQFRAGERRAAALIHTVKQTMSTVPDLRLEYAELVHPQTLTPLTEVTTRGLLGVAAYVGNTRLIDNQLLYARRPIVAIDGPAGAGKSTVTRQVADRLGLMYLDTGAMYRAVTWLVLQAGIALDDEAAIAEAVSQCVIELVPAHPIEKLGRGPTGPLTVMINGEDVTQAIRSLEVTAHVSAIAAQTAVRRFLVQQQQRYAEQGGIVAEGRDMGTYVFPQAELKIFLTASVQERARRRHQELLSQGQTQISQAELEQAIAQRDHLDSTRALAPLTQAADAIAIVTDNLSIAAVVDKIISLYHEKGLGTFA